MRYESTSVKDGQYDAILQLNQDLPLRDSRSSQQITAEGVAYQYDNVTPVKCDPLRQNVKSASFQELENEDQTRLSIASLQRDDLEPPDWSLNYQADDYQEATASNVSLSTRDLISWSLQIARVMDYLVSKKVLHGDLAARNVLLADDSVAKVADFGLARQLYQDYDYKKQGRVSQLPISINL